MVMAVRQPVDVDVDAVLSLAREARRRSLALVDDLDARQLMGAHSPTLNPLLWELGHIAWFQEFWNLRQRDGEAVAASAVPDADRLYNSSTVPRGVRWDLPLLDRQGVGAYLATVLDRVADRVRLSEEHPEACYFLQLATFHEHMHIESLLYTRQSLGYPAPAAGRSEDGPSEAPGGPWSGDVEVPGGVLLLGATPGQGFVFDNEKWAHPVRIAPFRIARSPVTNAEFLAFVAGGGYRREALWSPAGWRWRHETAAEHPLFWRACGEGSWGLRFFDRTLDLPLHAPLIHVSWYEAEAYCRWAGRRLPTEAEWEMAAATAPARHGEGVRPGKRPFPWGEEPPGPGRANLDGIARGCVNVSAHPDGDSGWGCRQLFGNVWEWCQDDFAPFPGFTPDPYREYSQPWFGDHKVLRGGAWATPGALLRNTWRNFYLPGRREVFAGFRTCAA
jgi:iron(II)-dependent oxidoreductase